MIGSVSMSRVSRQAKVKQNIFGFFKFSESEDQKIPEFILSALERPSRHHTVQYE